VVRPQITGRTVKTTARNTPAKAAPRATSVKVVHRVKAGETLTSIRQDVWHHGDRGERDEPARSNTIQTGQRLSIVTRRTLATD
jgi:hypothetical protein